MFILNMQTICNWRAEETVNYPIPRGNSAYALAKKAEYIEKNIQLAKSYYFEAIQTGDRTESALKDLASILHQEGNTAAACELLIGHQQYFSDQQKYHNLLANLQDKLVPVGNCLNKQLKLSPLTEFNTVDYIKGLFKDSSRIIGISINTLPDQRYAVVRFSSYSAARKTLMTFTRWDFYTAEWVNVHGVVVGLAGESKRRRRKYADKTAGFSMETAVLLLGKELMAELGVETFFNEEAQVFVPRSCQVDRFPHY